MKMVIIGGGNAAKTILDEFSGLEEFEIVGIVDPVESAPGMQRARELGIETGDDKARMIQKDGVSVIFELTGIKVVEDEVKSLLKSGQQMVSSFGAWITCNLIESHDKKTKLMADQVGQKFITATEKIEGTLGGMKDAASRMDNLLRHGHLVSLNAKVEAARAGESGKAFSVVVDEIQHLVTQLKSTLEHILSTSEITELTLDELRAAQAALADSTASESQKTV
jgi:uncharacterized protein YukE